MKKYLFLLLTFFGLISAAQESIDTTKMDYASIEALPEFPGGIPGLSNYISQNLHYPEVADLLGIGGKVSVEFVVGKNGAVTEVKTNSCVGAGCEAEAMRVLSNSPKWKPGIQNSRPVSVTYTLPITFPKAVGRILSMEKLRNSKFDFVFFIEGKEYLINDAEKILGSTFEQSTVESADKYAYPEKFSFPVNKEVYLIKMKNSKK